MSAEVTTEARRALYDHFLNPPNSYRGKPLWSWNGELEQSELIRQIHVFKQMGFGGFYIHARVGLKTEYLGEHWMELTRLCAEEAKRLGMEAWLYDEDRWPSGTAGGMVTAEPSYRLKFMRASTCSMHEFEWTEDTIAAFHCQLHDMEVSHCIQLERNEWRTMIHDYWNRKVTFEAEAGQWVILSFHTTEMASSTFYNGNTYLDTMNRAATDRFLALTHERYAKYCGDLFGDAIQGIFTDEPHRGSVLDGFGIQNPNKERHAPWTYDLFDCFQEAFGYDLIPRLPELFFRMDGNIVSQVKWHYIELLQRLFLERFAIPVQEWCRQNGLRLTGHVLHEDSLTAQTAMSGSVMRYYEHMDEPGIDVLTEGNRCYWIAKQLSSAARQLGKKWMFSELYGATGWQLSFQGHKAVGDWQALFGINVRSHHLAWYTMEGESKRDFPGSIGPQSAWWNEYAQVETYFARIGNMMSAGQPICDVLIINPIESIWCQVYAGWSSFLGAKSPEVIELERQYRELFHAMAGAQLDFDYGDEDLLLRYGSVARDEEGHPIIRVGYASYRAVILSGMVTIRSTTLDLLLAFQQQGGRIIVQGDCPSYVDALHSEAATELRENAVLVEKNQYGTVAQACLPDVRIKVSAKDSRTGAEMNQIYCQIRQVDDSYVLLALHMNRDEAVEGVVLQVELTGEVEEWDVRTGERYNPAVVQRDGATEIIANFPPSGEKLYLIHRQSSTTTSRAAVPIQYERTRIGEWTGPYRYRLSEPNVCVLDRAAYLISGGMWEEEQDILQIDRLLRSQLGLEWRNNKMIQPWYARKHGQWPTETVSQVNLSFRFYMDMHANHQAQNEPLLLAIEQPEQYASIRLNGNPLSNETIDFHWVDRCFQVLALPQAFLQDGENELLLTLGFHERFDLEPVYLLGSFGVWLDGTNKHIREMPECVQIGSLTEQGFPFYGGMIAYMLDSLTSIGDREDMLFMLPEIDGVCAKLVLRSGEELQLPWQPYETRLHAEQLEQIAELQLFLSRRNTFGPLHMVPVHSQAYSPDHYHTTGERYSEHYVLWPAGLPSCPSLLTSTPVTLLETKGGFVHD